MSFNTVSPPISENYGENVADFELRPALNLAHAYCWHLKEKKRAEKLARWASLPFMALLMSVYSSILRGRNLKWDTCYLTHIIISVLAVPCCICMIYLLLQRYKHALRIIVLNRWADGVRFALTTHGVTAPFEMMLDVATTEREKRLQIWGEKLFLAMSLIYMLASVVFIAGTCDSLLCL